MMVCAANGKTEDCSNLYLSCWYSMQVELAIKMNLQLKLMH